MRLIPHERALHQRYTGKPFAIIGVNGDQPEKFDRKRFEKDPLPWRSFQSERKGQTSISEEWTVVSWPTLFLIDHEGVIRRRWIGTPPTEQFDAEIERLVNVALNKTSEPAKPVEPKKTDATLGELPGRPGPKVHREGVSGDNWAPNQQYAVYPPGDYDPKKPAATRAVPSRVGSDGDGWQAPGDLLPVWGPPSDETEPILDSWPCFLRRHRTGSWLAERVLMGRGRWRSSMRSRRNIGRTRSGFT